MEVYDYYDRCFFFLQAYDWALECMKYISEKHDARNVKELRRYLMAHPSPTAQHFSEMMALANKLDNDKLIKQCNVFTKFTTICGRQTRYFYSVRRLNAF